MNDEGTDNAGPRLLWKSGEYRYWMNYEYKTGVKTDFKAEGFITQDDPEMFADAYLGNDVGEELAELPVGEATVTGKFKVTNISIGDGTAAFAVAHYGADGALKGVATAKNDAESYLINIPARSVPQTSIIGADKDENRANGLSAMGDPEVSVEIPYTATFEEGDRVKLFAWNMGIEQMKSIMQMPFEISTDGNRDLMREDFSYDGSDKLRLDEDTDGLFGDWEAKGYDSNGSVDFADNSYAAVTKAPFGNTALHLYRVGGQGIMASHTIPDTGGKDYTLEFTMRYIAEMSWRNISNQGFTLSNGIPTKKGDTEHPSAFQFRMTFNSDDENGRGTYGKLISSTAFDEVNQSNVFHNVALGRDLSDSERFARADYTKGVGYYDNVDGIYIHDYNDSLYIGSLFRVKVNVHPGDKTVDMSVFDGYRTASCRADYNNAANGNWDENPINTITFSVGSDTWGEIYIDDLCMHIADENDIKKNVTIAPASGSALALGSQWTMYPYADGSVTFFAPDDKAMDVGGQSTSVGATVSTYEFNNGDNQKFYLVGVKDGYLIRGKQSNLYLASDPNSGALTLQKKSDATVFTITDSAAGPSAAVLEIIRMIEDGTYEPTMDALFPEEEEITGEPENEPADVKPEIDFVEEI